MSRTIIRQLQSIRGLEVECPQCSGQFPISRGRLFSMYDSYPPDAQAILRERVESAKGRTDDLRERRRQLAADRKTRHVKITVSAKASNFGQIAEQILPAFRTFPYNQSECRILFKPIDYIVFTNLSANGRVEAIKFVDVKTGGGRLDNRQRRIRDRVQEGKIKHKVLK